MKYSDEALIVLNGNEEEIEFIHSHSFYHVQNLGTASIQISTTADIIGRDDGVIEIPAGGSATISSGKENKIYVFGSGKINVVASNSNNNPFRNPSKGGDSGGGGGGGVSTYSELPDKPALNGVTLSSGNTTFEQLGWVKLTEEDAENIVNTAFDKISGLITYSTSMLFDLTSIDIENLRWNDALGSDKYAELFVNTKNDIIKNDEGIVMLPDGYGVIETAPFRTIYAVFKKNGTGAAAINKRKTGTGTSSQTIHSSFDIETDNNGNITFITTLDNLTTDINVMNDYTVVCIARDLKTSYGMIYSENGLEGIISGELNDYSYQGTYLINRRIISGNEVYGKGNNIFKAILTDIVSHDEYTIFHNIAVLKNKYLSKGD